MGLQEFGKGAANTIQESVAHVAAIVGTGIVGFEAYKLAADGLSQSDIHTLLKHGAGSIAVPLAAGHLYNFFAHHPEAEGALSQALLTAEYSALAGAAFQLAEEATKDGGHIDARAILIAVPLVDEAFGAVLRHAGFDSKFMTALSRQGIAVGGLAATVLFAPSFVNEGRTDIAGLLLLSTSTNVVQAYVAAPPFSEMQVDLLRSLVRSELQVAQNSVATAQDHNIRKVGSAEKARNTKDTERPTKQSIIWNQVLDVALKMDPGQYKETVNHILSELKKLSNEDKVAASIYSKLQYVLLKVNVGAILVSGPRSIKDKLTNGSKKDKSRVHPQQTVIAQGGGVRTGPSGARRLPRIMLQDQDDQVARDKDPGSIKLMTVIKGNNRDLQILSKLTNLDVSRLSRLSLGELTRFGESGRSALQYLQGRGYIKIQASE